MNAIAREAAGFRDTWRYARAGGTAMQLRFALIMATLAACAGVWVWAAVAIATKL